MEFFATAAFGLEGLVKKELQRLGLEAKGEQGGARFEAAPEQAFRANLWLRSDKLTNAQGKTYKIIIPTLK